MSILNRIFKENGIEIDAESEEIIITAIEERKRNLQNNNHSSLEEEYGRKLKEILALFEIKFIELNKEKETKINNLSKEFQQKKAEMEYKHEIELKNIDELIKKLKDGSNSKSTAA